MVEKLLLNLTRAMKAGTPSERKIAKYLIEHLDELPFETAQTLAAMNRARADLVAGSAARRAEAESRAALSGCRRS